MNRPAVFLDRDGTIVDDTGYPSRFDQIRIFPRSFEAVRLLNEAGFPVVVVTNQSGVGRGYLTEAELAGHPRPDAPGRSPPKAPASTRFITAPTSRFSPDPRYRVDCVCRKPLPGLGPPGRRRPGPRPRPVLHDRRQGGRREVRAGDRGDPHPGSDRIRPGGPEKTRERRRPAPAAVAADLGEAVDWILAREKSAGS